MALKRYRIGLVIAVLIILSCGARSGREVVIGTGTRANALLCAWPDNTYPEMETRTVGTSGYTFRVGEHTVKIQNGALASPTQITVTESASDTVAVTITGPGGSTVDFAAGKPAEIKLYYGEKRCPENTDPGNRAIYRDSDKLQTSKVSGKKLRTYTAHTSYYVIAD